jgi:hypothetical protein
MPRRRITSGAEEVQYHFNCILKHINKPVGTRANGVQMTCFVAALAGMAHINKVDLGPIFERLATRLAVGPKNNPEPISDTVAPSLSESTKEPLTMQPPADIFGGLEDNDEA